LRRPLRRQRRAAPRAPRGRQGLGHEVAGRRQETLSDIAQALFTRPSWSSQKASKTFPLGNRIFTQCSTTAAWFIVDLVLREHFAPRPCTVALRQGMKRRLTRVGPRTVRTSRITSSEIRRVTMMSASIRCAPFAVRTSSHPSTHYLLNSNRVGKQVSGGLRVEQRCLPTDDGRSQPRVRYYSEPIAALVSICARFSRRAQGASSNSRTAVTRYTSLYANNQACDFKALVR
jgi:hypothetical protein